MSKPQRFPGQSFGLFTTRLRMCSRFCLPYNVQLTLAESALVIVQSRKVFTVYFGIIDKDCRYLLLRSNHKSHWYSSSDGPASAEQSCWLQYLQSALYRRSAIAIHSARCASANNFITCDNLILIIVTEIRDACVVIVYGKFQPDLFIDANFRIEVLITDQVTAARRNIFGQPLPFE